MEYLACNSGGEYGFEPSLRYSYSEQVFHSQMLCAIYVLSHGHICTSELFQGGQYPMQHAIVLYCKRADRIQQMRGANQSAGAPGMLLPTAGTNTALRSSVKQTHWSIRLRSRSTSASVLSEVE